MNQHRMYPRVPAAIIASIAGALVSVQPALATDGHFLDGVGTINQSMGGAGTGAMLDPLGMLKWNPAGSVEFDGTLIEGNFELFVPDRTLSSSIDAGSFGPGFPPVNLMGSTRSKRNVSLMPSLGFVRHRKGSDNAYHAGLLAVAGFGVEYNADPTNPILTPQAPAGMGFGKIKSSMGLILAPIGMSHRFNDKLSIGASIIPAACSLEIQPAPFAVPDDANGDSFPSYPRPVGTSWSYGIGGQIGVLYKATDKLSLGASFATPTWFTKQRWDAADELGANRNLKFAIDLPMHISAGLGFQLTPNTLLAADVRWINYEDTRGFKGSGFNPDGSVAGFGWRDIWAFGIGIQQNIGEKLKVRVGYNYGQNPIPAELSFFNSPAPAIVQHHVSFGLSYEINNKWTVHAGYYHSFQNTESGPYYSPMGAVPGTRVTNKLEEDSISVGFTLKY